MIFKKRTIKSIQLYINLHYWRDGKFHHLSESLVHYRSRIGANILSKIQNNKNIKI